MRSTATYRLSLLVRRIRPDTTLGRLGQRRPALHRLRVVERLHHSLQERTAGPERQLGSVARLMEEWRFRVDRCKKKLKNVEKVGMFFVGGLVVVSSHTFTTTPPRFTTQFTTFCTSKNAKPPCKTPLSPRQKKTTKYNAKGPGPSRWRRPAAAHTRDRPRSPSRRPKRSAAQ
jgi:hypothetical protein